MEWDEKSQESPSLSESPLSRFSRANRLWACSTAGCAPDSAHKRRGSFSMLTTRQAYDESVFAAAQPKHLQRMGNQLKIHAQALGYQLLPAKG